MHFSERIDSASLPRPETTVGIRTTLLHFLTCTLTRVSARMQPTEFAATRKAFSQTFREAVWNANAENSSLPRNQQV